MRPMSSGHPFLCRLQRISLSLAGEILSPETACCGQRRVNNKALMTVMTPTLALRPRRNVTESQFLLDLKSGEIL